MNNKFLKLSGAKAAMALATAVSMLGFIFTAPLALAGVAGSVGPTYPTTMNVGDTNVPVSLDITNNSTSPQNSETVLVTNIFHTPSCGNNANPICAPGDADPGVFAITGTILGRTGTACAATTFTLGTPDATTGEVQFNPSAPVILASSAADGALATCIIDFHVNVLKAPTKDSSLNAGMQTAQLARVHFTAETSKAEGSGSGSSDVTISKASPSIATTPSAGGVIGTVLNDTATLTGGSSPTGSVTFKLFPPSDATCASAAVYTDTDPTAPYATSPGFTSTAAGIYHWTADYIGDANNNATSSPCSAEAVNVADLQILIDANSTNEVNHSHTFTVTVNSDTGSGFSPVLGATVASGLAGTGSITGGTCTTTITDASGQCTIIVNSATAGVGTVGASTTVNVGGVSLTRALGDGLSGDSTKPTKTWVDANIQISPLTATDPINDNHILTGHVNVNTGTGGYVNAPDGTSISFIIDSGPGSFTTTNPCTTAGGTGSCTITLTSPTTGTTAVTASSTVVVGGVPLSRATGDANVGDSANASKTWTSFTAQMSTTIHNASHATVTSVPANSIVHDSAMVSGTNGGDPVPTGNVVFSWFGNSSCDGGLLATSSPQALSGGTVDATGFAQGPLSPGSYGFKASYAGGQDANYPNGATSACEPLTVNKIQPTIATTLSTTTPVNVGGIVHDSAILTNATADAGGTVTYNAYLGSQCSGTPVFTSTVTVASGLVPNSGDYTTTGAGTYNWQAVYSGDGKNLGATSACGTETLVVTQFVAQYCSPGYWKQDQHFGSWIGYTPDQKFSSVFNAPGLSILWSTKGKPMPLSNPTLLQALQANGGGVNLLVRVAVDALLNAASLNTGYTPAQVIAAFNAAYGDPAKWSAFETQFTATENCPLGNTGSTPVPAASVTTNPATAVASTTATVNGTNGPANASDTSFWLGTTSGGPFTAAADPTSQLPSGWSGVDSLTQLAYASFSHAYTGLTASTTYFFVAWSQVGGIWYPGAVLNFTTAAPPADLLGALSAEDFGVVNYDVGGGLGILKGYTAGFGLASSTLAGATSAVVKLYAAGDVLLQTNTAILPKFNADITGTQFSSPFDVSGTFNYPLDGYWTNVRESEYGQSVPAVKVVATVTLANTKVVTATNTNLTGDPATIYPVPAANVITNPATAVASTTATVNGTNGPANASDTSFWLGTTSGGPFTASVSPASQLPSGWGGIDSLAQLANASFSHAYTGLAPSTTYYFVAWSLVGGIWYPGAVLSFTTAP